MARSITPNCPGMCGSGLRMQTRFAICLRTIRGLRWRSGRTLVAERTFQPGFRLSALDVIVLIIGGIASAYVMTRDWWFGIAIAFVVLHFFLFCNVLRMSRPLELIWAGIFAAMAAGDLPDPLFVADRFRYFIVDNR